MARMEGRKYFTREGGGVVKTVHPPLCIHNVKISITQINDDFS